MHLDQVCTIMINMNSYTMWSGLGCNKSYYMPIGKRLIPYPVAANMEFVKAGATAGRPA